MKKLIVLSAIISLAIASCKKDKEKEQPKPGTPALTAKQTLLIGKDWKITSMLHIEDNYELTGSWYPCTLDNIVYHFTDANNGYFDEGGTKCNPDDTQRVNRTWSLINNENRLTVSRAYNPNLRDTVNIVNITASELKLTDGVVLTTLKN